jgi:C-8 sterol isomerase
MGYLFDPDTLLEVARTAAGKPFEQMSRDLTAALVERYPGHIDPSPRWMFNLAGGATGAMGLLHASLTEYLIIFGTPIGTEAYSGRYLLDIYDIVMTGEMWTYNENRFGERVVTKVGERAFLKKGQTKGYRALEGTWMLEYGRGLVPTALPMGLGDAVFSGQDPVTIFKTLHGYGRLVVKELLKGKL